MDATIRIDGLHNDAGKSTTMRVILGLDAPDAGTATIGGCPYCSLRNALFEPGLDSPSRERTKR
jgi:ABC-2 type transport system ATP-binding protein